MLKFTLDTDLVASTDVQYALFKAPAEGSGRMLGDSITTGTLTAVPSTFNPSGNVDVTITPNVTLSYPATYMLIMQGMKLGKRWGTGRIPIRYDGPDTPAPPTGTPPTPGTAPAPTWGTTDGVGGAPTVYAPTHVFYSPYESFQFDYTISGPRMAMNNSYQTWGDPGSYTTHVEGIDPAVGTYRGIFHTNGLALGTYDYAVIARNDIGQTRHNFKVTVGAYGGGNPPASPPSGTTPPPAGTPGTPDWVAGLADAPWFRSPQDYTTKWSTTENWAHNQYGDWDSLKLRGMFQGEANTWAVGPGGEQWHIHNNPNLFSLYVALSDVSRDMTVNFYLNAHCAVGLDKRQWGPGAHSEVKAYPSLGLGAIMGLTHEQDRLGIPRDIAAPLPCQLQDIKTLVVGWKKKTLNVSGNAIGHLAHDMRVCLTGARTSTYSGYGMPRPEAIFGCEFMIVHKQFGGYGNLAYRGTGRLMGTPTIAGHKYYVFIQEGATVYPDSNQRAMLLCFVPDVVDRGGELPDAYDIAPVVHYCMNTSYRQLTNGPGGNGKTPSYWWRTTPNQWDAPLLPKDSYFHQDVIGIEIEEGDFEITLESVFCKATRT